MLKKAITSPDFLGKTVLVQDPWDYIDLWLKREGHGEARFYWQQAQGFANAATMLPVTSSPVPAYYSILNATKTLLTVKQRKFASEHGVGGSHVKLKRALSGEKVVFKTNGVLPALCRHLGEGAQEAEYDLQQLLYNLPWIHRAYVLTYRSAPELFIPINNPCFVIKEGSTEAWFCADVEEHYASGHTTRKLPRNYERDVGIPNRYVVRKKSRFRWEQGKKKEAQNLERLSNYHHKVRKHVFYIYGPMRLWYLKRNDQVPNVLDRSSLTLTFAAMHRISELSRYDPLLLSRHLDRHHNWLLSEFIAIATRQFIDEIASEITGLDVMVPGTRMG